MALSIEWDESNNSMETIPNPTSATEPILTISIVTYNPDLDEFSKTLSALDEALSHLDTSSIVITIIDNSNDDLISSTIDEQLPSWKTKLINGQRNIGFGRGHNLVLGQIGKFHLILNPDTQLDCRALSRAISFMEKNPNCGLISPYAIWPDGQRQYLCKQYPAVFDLLMRGFAPRYFKELFHKRLSRYEMRAETQDDIYWNPPIISGCFMMFRGKIFEMIKGFDPNYFLYFEDFDLSIRTNQITTTAYVPEVKIVHMGGHAGKKGLWHLWQFAKSAFKFYRKHGIRLM